MPNLESSLQMRRSQVSAVPSPPPMQKPRIIAMVGFGHSSSLVTMVTDTLLYSATASGLARFSLNSLMSAPDTNALSPAPFNTITRIAGSEMNSFSAMSSPSHISYDMAL